MPFSEQQFHLIVIGGGLAGEGAIDEARACWLRCSLRRVSISNARMLLPHKPLTAVSNFDQTCERYGTDALFAPEYKQHRGTR